MHCDIFCRVIDNFGDIGVCWRLARELGARGVAVRLFADDPSALAWMAPCSATQVQVCAWSSAHTASPGDVVIEAFGCDPPQPYLHRLVTTAPAPRWINLEYLSAEAYVERSHGLPSPQLQGAARGLIKHFFYPGFTPGTGGLLREAGLLQRVGEFNRNTWLDSRGWSRRLDEQVVVLFGYRNAALPALLSHLACRPTLLLLAKGPASDQTAETLTAGQDLPLLRTVTLPYLPQDDFDRLLWSADLNFVRGEDSLVRSLWAGSPFVWQIYPQSDGSHLRKLEAFLDRMLATAPPDLATAVRAVFRWWNAAAPGTANPAHWPDSHDWTTLIRSWRDGLSAQPDLVTQLLRFVAARQ